MMMPHILLVSRTQVLPQRRFHYLGTNRTECSVFSPLGNIRCFAFCCVHFIFRPSCPERLSERRRDIGYICDARGGYKCRTLPSLLMVLIVDIGWRIHWIPNEDELNTRRGLGISLTSGVSSFESAAWSAAAAFEGSQGSIDRSEDTSGDAFDSARIGFN